MYGMATASTTEIFPWRDSYSVRIPQIDNQHKGLIRIINDLHGAMAQAKGKEALGRVIDGLIRYTESHFTAEEAMLKQRNYSQLAAHCQEHKKLTRQVHELRDKFRGGQITLTIETMQFLKSWLADHIMGHDQVYSRELVK